MAIKRYDIISDTHGYLSSELLEQLDELVRELSYLGLDADGVCRHICEQGGNES